MTDDQNGQETDAPGGQQSERPRRSYLSWLNWTWFKENARFALILAGAVLLLLVIVFLHDQAAESLRTIFSWFRSDEKVVLAVFPADDTTTDPIKEGLGLKGIDQRKLEAGGVLKFVAEKPTLRATANDLKDQLKNQNVVLVIGHYSSTTAEYMLANVYEQDESHPIPVILPAVTSPGIIPDPPNNIRHVLRLPASDKVQVKELRRLLDELDTKVEVRSKRRAKVLLAVDTTNPRYSDYLSREILKARPYLFVDSIGVSLTSDGFRPERYKTSDPDVVVFIGMEDQGSLFLRLLSESEWALKRAPKPVLIFTDGVAGNSFDALAQRVAEKGFRILLTAPIPAEVPRGDKTGGAFPNYNMMGQSAAQLADVLLRRAQQDYGRISRENVRKALEKIGSSPQDLAENRVKLKFDSDGENLLGTVHTYEFLSSGPIHSCACLSESDIPADSEVCPTGKILAEVKTH